MNQSFKQIMIKIKSTYGINQGEIAKKLGVAPTYLSDVSGGRAPFNERLRDRLKETFPDIDFGNEASPIEEEVMKFMRANTYTVDDLAKKLGVPTSRVIGTIAEGFDEESARLWSEVFGFNMNFLLTGEGQVMKSEYNIIPLLPVSAHAGHLCDFSASVSYHECEKIVSPLRDAEMAIPIVGESMYPELPSGSIAFIKKINEKAFIEWGKPYVIDTINGVLVKYLAPGQENSVRCISANPDPMYAPFEVSMSDILGIYRIVNLLCTK